MKRLTLAPEHKKFFQINGFISFEELVSSSAMKEIFVQIQKRASELPGFTQENLCRSLPSVLHMACKIGVIAAGLIDRKPVRVAYDCCLESLDQIPQIDDREVGLLISKSGKGFFFTDPSILYNEKEAWYLLIVFTANYVNTPIVFK